MLSRNTLNVWAAFAWAAAAVPTFQTSSGEGLVQLLERASSPTLNFSTSPEASIVYPDDPSWAADTHRWSRWAPPDFGVAFLPATEQDVTTALRYITDRNISFLATSGGHGSTVTLSSVEDGVAINLVNFNNVTVNDADETITVGGGAHFRDVWVAAYAAGRELALSTACVGVGGTTVGGGHGWLQGKYGLVIDEIVSMRVALWDGTIVTASATENSDLFWAMRGSGQNFGILLEFTLKTWPQTNGGNIYNVDMSFTDDSLEGVVRVINELIPNQPADLGMDFVMFTNATTNTPQLYLGLVYFGDRAKGDQLASRFATSKKAGIQRTHYNATVARWDELSDVAVGGFIDVACSGDNTGDVDVENLKVNVYTANLKQIDVPQTRQVYNAYKNFIRKNPAASSSTVLYEVFSQEAVKAAKDADTSYGNRNQANVLLLLQGIFVDDSVGPAVDAWGKEWRDKITKSSGYPKQYVYMNYAHGDEPLESMYGYEPWRLERLRKLKGKYDPHGFFNHYNSVLGTTAQGY
ncbi:hypothetical protein GGS23DRAFT_618979 [Durotheca rogersii]|uniref:uncharacterized protein n=1 Tax=Durotheca rogersii TaxID=419775 RepID=UPI00221E88E1|nr:uncharacterized protein GGS23DRAFT_618979 [Durotheca rogersii]KAI5855067.1 hypothetical protein GGS23DRAFT_618979 [Durotheca rogersii]